MNLSRRDFLFGAATVASGAVLAGCNTSKNGAYTADNISTGTSSVVNDAVSGEYKLVEDGKLTVAAELGFAPFEYMDEKTGEPVGFDVDLIKAVAEKLSLEASYLPNQKFDTLVPLVKQGGKCDVAIAGITITDERKEEVDFTSPYLDSNQAIVVKKDSGETEESLNAADKKVACQSGTTGDEWITENLTACERVPLDDVTAALTGVSTGLYNAMVIDLPVASYMLTQSFSDLEVAKEIPTGEQYGIAVSKDNAALNLAISTALDEMEDDGTMKEIKTKWFGSEI